MNLALSTRVSCFRVKYFPCVVPRPRVAVIAQGSFSCVVTSHHASPRAALYRPLPEVPTSSIRSCRPLAEMNFSPVMFYILLFYGDEYFCFDLRCCCHSEGSMSDSYCKFCLTVPNTGDNHLQEWITKRAAILFLPSHEQPYTLFVGF
jgi:hypothetical protein